MVFPMKITLLTTCPCWQSSGLLNGNTQRTFRVDEVPFIFSLHVMITVSLKVNSSTAGPVSVSFLHAELLVLCKVDSLKRLFFFFLRLKLLYEAFKAKRKDFYICFLFDNGKQLCQPGSGIIFHRDAVNGFYCKSE